MPLTRGNRRFYDLLLSLKVDDILTRQRLLKATDWTPVDD